MSGGLNWNRRSQPDLGFRTKSYSRPERVLPSYDGVAPEWRKITSKHRGTCGLCGSRIDIGEQVWWQKGRRNARHPACHEPKVRRQQAGRE